jgi:prepilin signal peptidase PulO-like enzyme (type II secretory pathway)
MLRLLIVVMYSLAFIYLAWIDLKSRLILNKIVYPAIALALIIAPFNHGYTSALIASAVALTILLVPLAATRGQGVGMGDLKLAFLIGLIAGFPRVLIALFLAITLAACAFLASRRQSLPFGPFLAVGAILVLLCSLPEF